MVGNIALKKELSALSLLIIYIYYVLYILPESADNIYIIRLKEF